MFCIVYLLEASETKMYTGEWKSVWINKGHIEIEERHRKGHTGIYYMVNKLMVYNNLSIPTYLLHVHKLAVIKRLFYTKYILWQLCEWTWENECRHRDKKWVKKFDKVVYFSGIPLSADELLQSTDQAGNTTTPKASKFANETPSNG